MGPIFAIKVGNDCVFICIPLLTITLNVLQDDTPGNQACVNILKWNVSKGYAINLMKRKS